MDESTNPQTPRGRQVLVVGRDLYSSWMISDVLFDAGYRVALCPGPEFIPTGCPLAEGRDCPLVEDSDIMLWESNLDEPANRVLTDTLRTAHPGKPLIGFNDLHRATRAATRANGFCGPLPLTGG